MSFIKFPTQIKPDRVTIALKRIDTIIAGPITNIQQVVSRGNPAWQWTYEYKGLSDSERDIVQAFLLNAKGSVNTFKVTDPANYEIKGSISNWIDIFSGHGFTQDNGADSTHINSWFAKSPGFDMETEFDETLRCEWREYSDSQNIRWIGHGGVVGDVNSYEAGKAYVQRVKYFQPLDNDHHSFSFFVGSGNAYLIQSHLQVHSGDSLTFPFTIGNNVTSNFTGIADWNGSGKIGDYWQYADYRLLRCALVSNSENLLTRSNEFNHGDWSASNIVVASGFGVSPLGVTSGAWHLFGNLNVNTTHILNQTITKITSEDIYTYCKYYKKKELTKIRLQIDDNGGTNASLAIFDLDAKTVSAVTDEGVNIRGFAKVWDVGSDWLRCQLTAVISSLNQVRGSTYLVNGAGSIQFTNSNSDGVEIFGAQLRKFPFMGHYVPAVASAIVGTEWQTGSQLYVDGFDAEDTLKSGQRFEVINRFHNSNSSYVERTEFKRLTANIKVHREGWALLEFDPPIRNAPVTDRSWKQQEHLGETMHNPVIFHQPEMKGRLLAGTIQYTETPLKTTDVIFDVIEDLTE